MVVNALLSNSLSTLGKYLGSYGAFNLFFMLVDFIIDPVFFFVVFYRIGSLWKTGGESFFDITKAAFIGALIGFIVGYFFEVELISQGAYAFNGSLFSDATLILSFVREATIFALVAFAGIVFGRQAKATVPGSV